MFRWEYFLKHKLSKNYNKMAFRKLRMERSLDKLKTLENFVTQVRGNEYNLTLGKLMQT